MSGSTEDDVPRIDVPIAGTPDGGGSDGGGDATVGDGPPEHTPEDALERWLSRQRATKADSTVPAYYYYQLKHFVEFCEDEKIELISDVTGWNLDVYEDHRRATGLKETTLRNELLTLRQFLRYCARIELV
jgi:site-specific recombinase XerD